MPLFIYGTVDTDVEYYSGGDKAIAEGIETLNKLSAQIDTGVMKPPAFKMILTASGNIAYTRKDGIYIVPVGCLRD